MRIRGIGPALAVATLLLAGCGAASHVATAPAHKAPTRIVEPPVPKIPAVPLQETELSPQTIASDVASLAALRAAHPGDGIIRGPGQLVFNIDLALAPKEHAFGAHLDVHMENNIGQPIPVLYFNVWPDAHHFRIVGGYEQVSHVTVDGNPVRFSLHGTLLRVYPQMPVAPGQSVLVAMDLRAKLPQIPDRYGWTGDQMALGNWFPMPAVHDQYGWVTPPYYSGGESFYSLTAAFHLHVTAPKGYVYAVTGDRQGSVDHPDGTVTTDYSAIGVRDVALMGDVQYEVLAGTTDGVRVLTYTTPRNLTTARQMERIGLQAMHYYDHLYGQYPFRSVSICVMQAWFDGMEYPRLVMVVPDPSFAEAGQALADRVTVSHELAHQWFFSLVGDDEYLTPWMDEAFATFSSYRFAQIPQPWWDDNQEIDDVTDPVSAFPDPDFSVAPSSDYNDAVYVNGAYALEQLRTIMGYEAESQTFDRMMRSYVQRYEYRVATSQDFLHFVRQGFGTQDPLFNLSAELATLSIHSSDAFTAPVNQWARLEEQENRRNWH